MSLWTPPYNQARALRQIHKALTAKGWGVATGESLTAGLISGALASQSGSSAYLRGGVAAYTLDAKVNLLGVDRELAASCNCVSNEVAIQMVLGVQKAFGVECAIAVTGYAEPFQSVRPHAFYAILCKGAMATGIVNGGLMGRNAMRKKVVEVTLCELAAMLKAYDEAG